MKRSACKQQNFDARSHTTCGMAICRLPSLLMREQPQRAASIRSTQLRTYATNSDCGFMLMELTARLRHSQYRMLSTGWHEQTLSLSIPTSGFTNRRDVDACSFGMRLPPNAPLAIPEIMLVPYPRIPSKDLPSLKNPWSFPGPFELSRSGCRCDTTGSSLFRNRSVRTYSLPQFWRIRL